MSSSAYRFRALAIQGSVCVSLDEHDAIAAIRNGDPILWADVLAYDAVETGKYLIQEFGFHELQVEDALNEHERPSLRVGNGYTYVPVPVISHGKEDLEVREFSAFVSRTALVTVSTSPCHVIDTWFDRWEQEPHLIGEQPVNVLYVLLDHAVDDLFPIIDAVEEDVEVLLEKVYDGDPMSPARIMQIKRRLLRLRRSASPFREVLNAMLRRDSNIIPVEMRPYFEDVYDHLLRVTESVDLQRDGLTSLLDVQISTASNRLNEVVKKMTVVATVLMTMSLVAGVYGMNFDQMPELHWAHGYGWAIGLMLAGGAGVIAAFRWSKWL